MPLPKINKAVKPINVLFNPEKYRMNINVEKIIADKKVYREGVERYKNILKSGKEIGTLVVVKHPKEDLYAVLDGHHRFWAFKEMEFDKIKCAVIQDSLGILFNLTKDGHLQPMPEFTQYFIVPMKKFEEQLNEFKKKTFNPATNS